MHRRLVFVGMIACSLAGFAAQAEMGAVGAQVPDSRSAEAQPVDQPTQENRALAQKMPQPSAQDSIEQRTQAKEQAAAAPEPEKALLEINFDRKRVYYDRALSQGVAAAERAKPGVVYEVVSYPPAAADSDRANSRINEQMRENVTGVVQQLRARGVPDSRISVITQPAMDGQLSPPNHRVAIFVR